MVSESCVDSLLTEMVSMYCNRLYTHKPELAASRIHAIGYQVGHQLSERYTMERPGLLIISMQLSSSARISGLSFSRKQIGDLKINHRVTSRIDVNLHSSTENGDVSQENSEASAENKAAQVPTMHLHFSCRVIKGALHNLGITCAVSVDTSHLPAGYRGELYVRLAMQGQLPKSVQPYEMWSIQIMLVI